MIVTYSESSGVSDTRVPPFKGEFDVGVTYEAQVGTYDLDPVVACPTRCRVLHEVQKGVVKDLNKGPRFPGVQSKCFTGPVETLTFDDCRFSHQGHSLRLGDVCIHSVREGRYSLCYLCC